MNSLSVVLIVVAAIALLAAATAGLVVRRGRLGRGIELEPPARASSEPAVVEAAPADTEAPAVAVPPDLEAAVEEALVAPPKPRLRERLAKARGVVSGYLGSVLARSDIDEETWDDLEEALIRADVGAGRTGDILDGLRARVKAESISGPAELVSALKTDIIDRLQVDDRSLRLVPGNTAVWIFVGVNGVGKTTTVGKLGARETSQGRSVVMVAGDTFRAAAAEQLETWAERSSSAFIRGAEGADPSSVIYDGIEAGVARSADVVLCDTAGRLHNKSNLMDELRKVRRVADKAPGEVAEVLLVIDATTGQNGLEQARVFTEAVEVTGVVLTKLDGSAKGGIVLAIQAELGIPVKLVGLGETVADLVTFEPEEFVNALLATD